MKTFKYFVIAVMTAILAACKGGTISPVSEKIQGSLGEYFEIVSRNYKAKDGKISIEIERIKDGFPSPWKEGMEVGYSDGKFEPCFSVEFQDADGNVILKDKTEIVSDENELNTIANLSVDESATITFDCEEGVALFKMSSTFKLHGEQEMTLNLEGGIGKYPILMTMHINADGTVTGAYYYKSKGPGNYLYVKGEKSEDRIILNEFTKDGNQTGTYEGIYKNDVFKGHFNTKSGNYEFTLKPTNMSDIDFSNIDFDSFNAKYITYDDEQTENEEDSYSSLSNSEDWDALLDSYDSYVTKYISYMKKAARGDVSALTEYPSLMEKAQELSDRMSGAQGEMSSSQWARYINITNKMSRAAQEMR